MSFVLLLPSPLARHRLHSIAETQHGPQRRRDGMSVVCCGLESVVGMACARWVWRRCTHAGARDSEAWPPAAPDEFGPVPRACRAVLAAYEDDLAHPRWAPAPHGYGIDPAWLATRATYDDTLGRCPPYIIYADPVAGEVVLAVRGLGLGHDSDYRVLLDNRTGAQPFDDGFVHRGLLRAALWLLDREVDRLCRLLKEHGPECRLVLVGHSLGAGIAALMAVLVVNHLDHFGGISRTRVRCYAVAPARCMSLNLAVKYADVIHSVVLQDDFLPRTPTPLEHMFGSVFCLPCLLFFVCMRDTFMSEDRKLKDPRRLYAPGRMYHIVERKSCRCGRFPPVVRTAIPVEGRFEHIVLSCNAIFDHSIVWIEREAEKALERMKQNDEVSIPPALQKMEREQSIEKEHKDAMERAESLHLLHSVAPEEGTSEDMEFAACENRDEVTSCSESQSSVRTNWDELVEQLLDGDESEDLVFKEDGGVSCSIRDYLPVR